MLSQFHKCFDTFQNVKKKTNQQQIVPARPKRQATIKIWFLKNLL